MLEGSLRPALGEVWVQRVVSVPPPVAGLQTDARYQWAQRSVSPELRCRITGVATNDRAEGPDVGHVWIHVGFGAALQSGFVPGSESVVDVTIETLLTYWRRL